MSKYKPDAGKADLRQHIPDGVLSDRKTLAKLSKVDALNIPDGILPNKEAEAFLHTITADAPRDDRPQPKVRTATLDGYRETAKRIGKRHTPQPDAAGKGAINIVFDGPPGPEAGRFVEVEDDDGHGIKVGEWIQRENGCWNLHITTAKQPPLDVQAVLEAKLTAIIKWLEMNQPDVFRRGLWEALQAGIGGGK